MKLLRLTGVTIYRYRYFLGYATVLLLLLYALTTFSFSSPGGISAAEKQSVIDSSTLRATNIASINVVDLPYRVFQHLMMLTFGVSNFSIKFPSVVIAFCTAIGVIFLLRRWFHRHMAVLTSLVALTTSEFLFLTQDGTPNILYVFWSVWLLLFGTYIAKKVRFLFMAKVMFFIGLALSLYTPLSFYTLGALALTAFLHPHLRYLFKQLPKGKLTGAFVFGSIAIVPLVFSLLTNPSTFLTLLGIPTTMPDFWANIRQLAQTFFGFTNPSIAGIMTPFFGLGSMLLIGLGLFRLIKTRAATQSYLILIWMLILTPIIILNPDKAIISFLPMTLLLATGLDYLIDYWYSLFPRNPYARVGGIIPLLVLVTTLVWSGFERYTYGYHYSPQIYSYFSDDINLLKNRDTQIVVSEKEKPFYLAMKVYHKSLDVQTQPYADSVTATHDVDKTMFKDYSIEKIITSSAQNDSDRFYIYKKNAK